MVLETFFAKLITDVATNILSDLFTDKILKKSEIEQAQQIQKHSEYEFQKLIQTMIHSNKSLEVKLQELYKKSRGDVSVFIQGDQYNFNNSIVHINEEKGCIECYQKGIDELNRGDYLKAIEYLKEFPKNMKNTKDAELLIIASKLCLNTINKLIENGILEKHEINKYIQNEYLDSYLGLVILGIIYFDYLKDNPKDFKEIEKKLKLIKKNGEFDYITKILNCSEKDRSRLGLKDEFKHTFRTSGEPSCIEAYRCFTNIAHNNPIDGMELKKLNDTIKKRWHFFYQYDKKYIGILQKNERASLTNIIEYKKNKLQKLISTLTKLSLAGIGLVILLTMVNVLSIALILNILKKGKNINEDTESIRKDQKRKNELQEEINFLLEQLPVDIPTTEDIICEFLEDLEFIKIESLKNLQDLKGENNAKLPNPISFKEWAFLQPMSNKEKLGFERTGIKDITDDIKYKISTYVKGNSDIDPFYRVWFIQFVYILEKDEGVNTYSLFYDFITKKQYGNKSQTFKYNHISNLSISEIKLKSNDVYKNLNISSELIEKIYIKDFHLLTFAVSSGESLHCVIENKEANKEHKNSSLKQAYKALKDILEKIKVEKLHKYPKSNSHSYLKKNKSNIPDYH